MIEVTKKDRDAADNATIPLLAVVPMGFDVSFYRDAMARAFAAHRIAGRNAGLDEAAGIADGRAEDHAELAGYYEVPVNDAERSLKRSDLCRAAEARWIAQAILAAKGEG